MKRYETPELKSIYFDIKNRTMDGYDDGDIIDNPWGDEFLDDPESSEDTKGVLE